MEQRSWKCIECGAINAPHIDQCSCTSAQMTEAQFELIWQRIVAYLAPATVYPITPPNSSNVPKVMNCETSASSDKVDIRASTTLTAIQTKRVWDKDRFPNWEDRL